jgi:hypothetical protein
VTGMRAEDPALGTPRSHPGQYVHGINIVEFGPAWNVALAGRLWSPDFLAVIDPGLREVSTSIHDATIDFLREHGSLPGAMTPHAGQYIAAAAYIRRGGIVGIGHPEPKWFSREKLDYIVRRGDVELAFEERRRRRTPQYASRLNCLYVADDSEAGRQHVLSMLIGDIHVLRVTIPMALRPVHRADTKWYDLYFRERREEYIDRYWAGEPHDSASPTWEYLVDGMIEVHPEDVAHIRKLGHPYVPPGIKVGGP